MADPRTTGPQMRSANYSPLMRALSRKSLGEIVNFCPFGCSNDNLDELGFCGHLVGFYNGGQTYEPRIPQKTKAGRVMRIITDGSKRCPMKQGYRLVKITTTARVYSPTAIPDLVVRRDEYDKVMAEVMAKEQRLIEAADAIRNPVLDGVWGETLYDSPVPATTA